MCTVTFIPTEHTIFLTSNRDEKHRRTTACAPAVYGKLLFPKDGDAGGTWIAAHENGNAIVFLNGGFIAHTPNPPYRKSRGLILTELIHHPEPFFSFTRINLNNIEPFTAIIWGDGRLFECRWDGTTKHSKQLDESKAYIWSSVTLYDPSTIAKRSQWFEEWIRQNANPLQENILHFHQFTGDGDRHNDLKMDRGQVFTVSVTSLALTEEKALMQYLDLKNDQTFRQALAFEKSLAGRSK